MESVDRGGFGPHVGRTGFDLRRGGESAEIAEIEVGVIATPAISANPSVIMVGGGRPGPEGGAVINGDRSGTYWVAFVRYIRTGITQSQRPATMGKVRLRNELNLPQ